MRTARRRLREGTSRRTLLTVLVALLVLAGHPVTAQAAAPANDNFEAAILVRGESAFLSGSNVGATKQPGEPSHPGVTGQSVWYRWVATWNGELYASVDTGAMFSAKELIYEDGDPNDDGAHIEDLTPIGGGGTIPFVRRGETYWIAVDSGLGSGSFTLSTWLRHYVEHDQFPYAKQLTGAHATDRSSNVHATFDTWDGGREPYHLWPWHARETVWYRWEAPASGRATVDLGGSDFDTLTAVYTGPGPVDRITKVASTGDATLSFRAEARQSYFIVVATEIGAAGSIELALDLAENAPPDPPAEEPPFEDPPGPPANDDFANAQELIGLKPVVTASNADATKEPGEPAHTPSGHGRSVWYRWTPPRNGRYLATVETDGSKAVVAAYTGSSVSDLEVPEFGTAGAGTIGNYVRTTKTYYFAVDTYEGEPGKFTLRFALDAAAENDEYADATVLTGFSSTDVSYLNEATPDFRAPVGLYSERDPSVWYRWTAPATGVATLDLSASHFAPMEGVYEEVDAGDCRFGWVDQQRTEPVLRFWAREGKTYRIVVGGRSALGQLKLALNLVEAPLPPDYEPPVLLCPSPPPQRYFGPNDPGMICPPQCVEGSSVQSPPGEASAPERAASGQAEQLELSAHVSPQKLRSVLSRGLTMTVGCPRGPCTVRVSGSHFRAASVKAKRPTKVVLKLTPSAKRKLARRKSLKSAVRVTARGSGGRTATLTRRLTIER